MSEEKPCWSRTPDGITLRVRVQPRASHAGIAGVKGDTLRVRLNGPPADGRANAELIEMLSKTLHIRKTDIEIVRGHTAREKTVAIKGLDKLPEGVASEK